MSAAAANRPAGTPLLGLAGSFAGAEQLLQARRLADAAGLDSEAFVPAPEEALIRKLRPQSTQNPVRLWTLLGGIGGGAAAFAMTIWMSKNWPLVVGGKPIVSMPPFIDVAFEWTVLFGAVFCALGLLRIARLPRLRFSPAYRPEFVVDRYGLLIRCSPAEEALARGLLAGAQAERIWPVRARLLPPLTLPAEVEDEEE